MDNDWIAGVDQDRVENEIQDVNENENENEPEMDGDYDKEQQGIAETLHEPRETNPIIPDKSNEEVEESDYNSNQEG